MNNPLRLGSVCTGYGGLDLAVAQVLDVEPAWVADPDPGPAAILTHHWPAVPNLGDITRVDWTAVPHVDVVAAGFPCQDLSYAGRGAGIKEGTRSGLWHVIAAALGVLRPRLVVLENVRGIVVRRPGLDVVLADLARLGLDASWTCVRASDVGAPHRRERWFLVAEDADRATSGERRQPASGQTPGGRARTDARGRGRAPTADAQGAGREGTRPEPAGRRPERGGCPPTDSARDGRHEGWPESTRLVRRPDAPLGRDAATHTDRDETGDDRQLPPRRDPLQQRLRHDAPGRRTASTDVEWGTYGPAIDRWARVLGRPAPHSTEPGRDGRPRLSPAFVEWLMGLPVGHVTDVPGLTRNQMLKALGNGVVPQQGGGAIAVLLDRIEAPA